MVRGGREVGGGGGVKEGRRAAIISQDIDTFKIKKWHYLYIFYLDQCGFLC